jgi:hypothetical protein
MGGSSGCAASRTPACSATGTLSSRNRCSRPHSSSCEIAGRVPAASVLVVHHVPDRPIRDGDLFAGTIHSHCDRMPASQRSRYTPAHAGHTEVVAKHRNAGLAQAAHMIVFTCSICCGRVGPSSRISCQCAGSRFSTAARLQPSLFDFRPKRPELLYRPKPLGIAGHSPSFVLRARRLVIARVRRTLI